MYERGSDGKRVNGREGEREQEGETSFRLFSSADYLSICLLNVLLGTLSIHIRLIVVFSFLLFISSSFSFSSSAGAAAAAISSFPSSTSPRLSITSNLSTFDN